MTRFILSCLILLAFSAPAYAEDGKPQPVKGNFGELKPDLSPIRVQAVIDPLTILGQGGTIYKLTGIDVPENSDIAVAALKELNTLLTNQDVKLYQTRDETQGRSNRLGQALVQMERKKDSTWVQGELLAKGLARVRTTPSNAEMAAPMLILEAKARESKLGLWADPAYAIVTPEQAAERKNSFQIVEGKIFSVSQKNNEIFLNFAADWKKDFTIGVPTTLRRDLSRRNINFLNLAHQSVRVRGWVEDRNGPFITLDHAQQLELLDKGAPSLQEPIKGKGISQPAAPDVTTPEVTAPEVEEPKIDKPVMKGRTNE